jgi:hypothetical protein
VSVDWGNEIPSNGFLNFKYISLELPARQQQQTSIDISLLTACLVVVCASIAANMVTILCRALTAVN